MDPIPLNAVWAAAANVAVDTAGNAVVLSLILLLMRGPLSLVPRPILLLLRLMRGLLSLMPRLMLRLPLIRRATFTVALATSASIVASTTPALPAFVSREHKQDEGRSILDGLSLVRLPQYCDTVRRGLETLRGQCILLSITHCPYVTVRVFKACSLALALLSSSTILLSIFHADEGALAPTTMSAIVLTFLLLW